MNDFTLEELHDIHGAVEDTLVAMAPHLADKIQSIIDNYSDNHVEEIVESHLKEATSLINHAMCLLGFDE